MGQRYFPIQQAALEMRINNSLYAMGIRNYIFWRSAKYLEAAKSGASHQAIDQAVSDFQRQLRVYSSFAESTQEKQWVKTIRDSQEELHAIGGRIIALADQLEDTSDAATRRKTEDSIDKLMMNFEGRLYRIDDFLDGSVQKSNLAQVRRQIQQANAAKERAVLLLSWSLIVGLLIGGQTAWLVYRNRRRERERREELVRRMIRVEEEQRENLSLQVHDQMGQDLSGLRIYLDLIDRKLPAEDAQAKKSIVEGKRILSGLINKSHNIAELLRPPALEELGLVDTLEGLILQYRQMSELRIDFQKPKEEVKLSKEHSLVFYRLTQEGLTNILKHAQAKNVEVKLEAQGNIAQLAIRDDGIGFDYKKDFLDRPSRRKNDRTRLGLVGLRERVELLGGRMEIRTAPGEGTLLQVQLPVTKM